MLTLELSHVENPDITDGGYWSEQYRPEPVMVAVASLEDAAALSQQYIGRYDLGGGNWTGGRVTTDDGRCVARIAYNGRIFPTET